MQGYEKAWGSEHNSTLDTVNNLGVLYAGQGKMAEVDVMYIRALQGYKNVTGVPSSQNANDCSQFRCLANKT